MTFDFKLNLFHSFIITAFLRKKSDAGSHHSLHLLNEMNTI